MTNGELIKELQCLPPHCPVMLVTHSMNHAGLGMYKEWSFVGDVQIRSNCGDIGTVVTIMAEDAQ
jgi:hypothetical protein